MAERALIVTIDAHTTSVSIGDDGVVHIEGVEPVVTESSRVPGEYVIRRGGRQERFFAVSDRDTTWVFHDGTVFECTVEPAGAGKRRSAHHHGSLTAPMPATVIAVHVTPGEVVTRGQTVVLLEAMKMELPLKAPGDGVVAAVHCRPGDLVQPNVSLIDLE
jgi:acetyl-CoA/propionyl-CoA carboxylase, biotin carboxylase, biotin carboxyl carrier protein